VQHIGYGVVDIDMEVLVFLLCLNRADRDNLVDEVPE
jgi:hypothetical protein